MTKPKPRVDPFALALSALDRRKPLSIAETAAFLGRSRSTLDGWHAGGKPPPRRRLNDGPAFYLAGDVQDLLDDAPLANDPAARLLPPMRGGRRRKWPTSFVTFLAAKEPGDGWLFTMIPEPAGSGLLRPVDFIEALGRGMGERQRVEVLTLAQYADALARWCQGVARFEQSERLRKTASDEPLDVQGTSRGRRA